MKNADMPAMPFMVSGDLKMLPHNVGLTKREMMAMHMMASIQASGGLYDRFESMAKDATTMADSLLAELERTCQKP